LSCEPRVKGIETIQEGLLPVAAARLREIFQDRPMIETYPFEKAAEAYARMMKATHSSASF
jgi:hypothetical protein